ncbi:hypothetical protein ABIB51_003279 [Arthrobacter sp. UYCu712]
MSVVFVTGMSGAGKSTLLRELDLQGFDTVDTDYDSWCIDVHGDCVWDERRMASLLARNGPASCMCPAPSQPGPVSRPVRRRRPSQRTARRSLWPSGYPDDECLGKAGGRARRDSAQHLHGRAHAPKIINPRNRHHRSGGHRRRTSYPDRGGPAGLASRLVRGPAGLASRLVRGPAARAGCPSLVAPTVSGAGNGGRQPGEHLCRCS